MHTEIEMKRHPLAAGMLALMALLAAGCGNESEVEGPAYGRNAPPARQYAQYVQPGPRAVYDERFSANQPAPREQAFTGAPQRITRDAEVQPERSGDRLHELMAWERQDAGVRPTRELHSGAMHGPTPNQIPGGQVITTKGLIPLLQQGIDVHVFDVLGGNQSLPNAFSAAWAAEPGSFDDQTQQQFARLLEQVTRGNANAPLVFYCQGPQCWMSYNASLRAIALGYRNVLWYRGGTEAWQHAGLRLSARRG